MTRIDELDTLKTLDPATGVIDPRGDRARADLQRILTTDPTLPAARPRTRRKVARRVALGTGLVAAATMAALVLPSVLGGDKAFASWTAAPATMSAQQSASAAAACRDRLKEASNEDSEKLSAATPSISERRGSWSLVLLTGRDGFSGLCISDEARPLFRSFFGSVGSRPSADQPARRGLKLTDFGAGSIDGRYLSVAVGLAGPDVSVVVYNSASRGKVKATLADGRFALWLPGNELEQANRVGVPLQLTYRDGSTVTTTVMP